MQRLWLLLLTCSWTEHLQASQKGLFVRWDKSVRYLDSSLSVCTMLTIMQEGQNPFGGVESFDTVYYAALQIVVLASVNTVSVSFFNS